MGKQVFFSRKSRAHHVLTAVKTLQRKLSDSLIARGMKSLLGAKAAWAAFGVMTLALTMMGLTVSGLRSDAVKNASDDIDNIATVLAQQAKQSVEAIDLLLSDVQSKLSTDEPSDEEFTRRYSGRETFDYIAERISWLPGIDVLTITNSEGRIINFTRSWPAPEVNLADREYFTLVQSGAGSLYISPPVVSKVTGRPVIFFVKRLTGVAGSFRGIVQIGLQPTYFRDVYEAIKSLPHQTFALQDSAGNILARYSNGAAETDELESSRIMAVRKVGYFPLAVHVGVTQESALASWRSRARLITFGTLSVCTLLVLILFAFRRQAHELKNANTRMDLAMNNMSQGLCFFDERQRLILCNDQYLDLYSVSKKDVQPGITLSEIFNLRIDAGSGPKLDSASYLDWRRSIRSLSKPSESVVELQNGAVVKICHQPMRDGGWVATHQDITSSHRNEGRLTFLAHHDVLTGLANRQGIKEKIELARTALRDGGRGFAILMLDLDRFKAVNDTLGHAGGDALLRQVAQRLQDVAPETAEIARLGGDEFAILLLPGDVDDPVTRNSVARLADRICGAINEPFKIGTNKVVVAASIGVSFAENDQADADTLLDEADVALYALKKQGGNSFAFFDAKMQEAVHERTKLETDMRAGLEQDEFELHYQVYVDVHSGRTAGMEALVRWRHAEYGLIAPVRFIPIAESSGFIGQLGEWILQQACHDAASFPVHMKVAVNVSAVQFRKDNLVNVVTSALRRSGLPPENLGACPGNEYLIEQNKF